MDWFSKKSECDRQSPSRSDGVAAAKETDQLFSASAFLEKVCTHPKIDLRITVHQKATLLLHQFYRLHSLRRFEKYTLSVACVFLVSKVEEELVKAEGGRRSVDKLLRALVTARYDVMHGKDPGGRDSYFLQNMRKDRAFQKECARVVWCEPALLCTMGFELRPALPITAFLKRGTPSFGGKERFKSLKLIAPGMDILRDLLCLGASCFMGAEDLGCAALLLAALLPREGASDPAPSDEELESLCGAYGAQAECLLNMLCQHPAQGRKDGQASLKMDRRALGAIYDHPAAAGFQRRPPAEEPPPPATPEGGAAGVAFGAGLGASGGAEAAGKKKRAREAS